MSSVYVISCGDYVKIGLARSPEARLKRLLAGLPEVPHLAHSREFPSRSVAREIEQLLHWRFRESRTRGEWFRIPVQHAISALNEVEPRSAKTQRQTIERVFGRDPTML